MPCKPATSASRARLAREAGHAHARTHAIAEKLSRVPCRGHSEDAAPLVTPLDYSRAGVPQLSPHPMLPRSPATTGAGAATAVAHHLEETARSCTTAAPGLRRRGCSAPQRCPCCMSHRTTGCLCSAALAQALAMPRGNDGHGHDHPATAMAIGPASRDPCPRRRVLVRPHTRSRVCYSALGGRALCLPFPCARACSRAADADGAASPPIRPSAWPRGTCSASSFASCG